MIIENIKLRPDLTTYARSKLECLNKYLKDNTPTETKLTEDDIDSLYNLMRSLYNADFGSIHLINQYSSGTMYKDLEVMNSVATKIQFWARNVARHVENCEISHDNSALRCL